ncbi:MAG: hypothetical protein JSS97_09735 [Actinobacteria bacterium]|nr:hypothetical protein [Actinomycetota bacterium]
MALLAFMLSFAAAAHAEGRFVYETCDWELPAGNPPPLVFSEFWEGNYELVQSCASPGGSIGIRQAVPQEFTLGVLEASIPSTPGGWVESVTLSAGAGEYHNNSGSIVRRGPQSAVAEYWPAPGPGDVVRSFQIRGEPPSVLEGPTERETVFDITLSCAYGRTCEPGAYIGTHYLAATEVDPTPPMISGVEGSLLAGNVLRGHQTIEAQASDVGGGVRTVELKVNGLVVPGTVTGACSIAAVENPSYKGLVATSPTPCPPSLPASWTVDTTAPPFQNGANTVQVCASDLATKGSPNTTCSDPQTVSVDNTCTESPVAGGSNLSTTFAQNQAAEVTVPYGIGATVTGQLDSPAGQPVVGATICVQVATEGSPTGPSPAGTATTDAEGNFTYALPPGPNRSVMFGYRHDSFQVADSLHYYAHVRPTIRLSAGKLRNGDALRIHGHLPGEAAAGRVVVLKASALHSKKWYPFGETTTDATGHYHYRYRFSATTRTTIYRMEAVVPRQSGFPWKAGHSKPALVEVRG